MPDFNEIIARIKDILSSEFGEKKVFDKDIAKALEINQVTFATMKSRKKIPYEQVLNFCARKKISINWLLYNQIVDSLKQETEKFIRVKYFKDIYASAGGGAENYDDTSEYINVDEEMLSSMSISNTKMIEAINVVGDSMEPTLEDGNIVFIDKNITQINKGGIFIVSTPGGLFIKRVQLKTDDTIDLISDNSSYAIENLASSDIQIVGKVIGAISQVG